MPETSLALLWHMHQPLYRLGGEQVCYQPWVRLHATRAYYDMIRVLEEFPAVRVTLNVVPTLLDQVQAYERGGSDAFREAARLEAADLDPAQRRFLVDHFFSAQEERLIRPLPRFAELFEKRRAARSALGEENAWRDFATADLRDLQALFDLAWFGFKAEEEFEEVRELKRKGKGFTPADVLVLHGVQDSILKNLLPLYRAAAARGQVEISASAYAHPILPLLVDSDSAREAMPESPLPPRFRAPDDATRQIAEGIERVTEAIGVRPRGVWPSEGSVSDAAVELMGRCGVGWAASDGDVLLAARLKGEPDLSRPWRLAGADGAVDLIFRDHDLSDRIGFTYARADPQSSVAELLAAAAGRAGPAPGGIALIALDGENPWEQYAGGGAAFVRALYGALEAGGGPKARTVGEAIAACPRRGVIEHLRPGSWINADFGIWIGGPEKNRAWTLLGETRERLAGPLRDTSIDATVRAAAWESLRAAEGSDWFWWLDDQFDSLYRADFDRLFRSHLAAACAAAGVAPPEAVRWPVRAAEPPMRQPAARPIPTVDVGIDGYEGGFFEWRGALTFDWGSLTDQGAMQRARQPFESLRCGLTPRDELCLRIDPDHHSGPAWFSGMEVALRFANSAGVVSDVTVELDAAGEVRLARPDGTRAAARKIFEMAIPAGAAGLGLPGTVVLFVRVRVAGETHALKEIVLCRTGPAAEPPQQTTD